jgi:hypothetical protein
VGLFVPKPSRGTDCQRRALPDLGTIVRQCGWCPVLSVVIVTHLVTQPFASSASRAAVKEIVSASCAACRSGLQTPGAMAPGGRKCPQFKAVVARSDRVALLWAQLMIFQSMASTVIAATTAIPMRGVRIEQRCEAKMRPVRPDQRPEVGHRSAVKTQLTSVLLVPADRPGV